MNADLAALVRRPLAGLPHSAYRLNTALRSLVGMVSRIQVKPPLSFISRAPFMNAARARRDRAPPTLRRLTPTASISAALSDGSAALITTFIGLPTDDATSFMVA